MPVRSFGRAPGSVQNALQNAFRSAAPELSELRMLRMRSGALRILITRSELLAERQTAWPLRDQSWRCDNPRARCPSGLPRWWTCVQPQLPPHGQRPSSLSWHPLLCDADLFEEMRIPIPVVFVRSPARETFVRSQLACLGLSQLARGAALADASAHPRTEERNIERCPLARTMSFLSSIACVCSVEWVEADGVQCIACLATDGTLTVSAVVGSHEDLLQQTRFYGSSSK